MDEVKIEIYANHAKAWRMNRTACQPRCHCQSALLLGITTPLFKALINGIMSCAHVFKTILQLFTQRQITR
jgi:hypothetical protein